jgi:hypothetical protein
VRVREVRAVTFSRKKIFYVGRDTAESGLCFSSKVPLTFRQSSPNLTNFVAHASEVRVMTFQENSYIASGVTVEKVLWSPRKVPLVVDRSHLNLQSL